jgi:DNA-binding beta-propeller fold protein YncE
MRSHFSASLLCLSLLSACQAPLASIPNPSSSAAVQETVLATIAVGQAPHGMAAAQGFVYNSNSAENTVSVIDSRSDKVLKTLTLPQGKPGYAKALHNESHVLLLNPEAGLLHVIAPAQDHALLQSIAVGAGPDKLQISADDKKVWVSLSGEAAVTELDFSQGMDKAPIQRKLAVGKGSADGHSHRSLVVGLQSLAVPNPGDNDVSLVHFQGAEPTERKIHAGNNPAALAFVNWDNQDQVLAIGNSASNTLSFYSLATEKTMTLSDSFLAPTDMVVVAESQRVFVTLSGSNEVAALDARNQRLLGRIATGQRPVHIYLAPALMTTQHEGHDHAPELWVGNDSGDSVTVIDADTLAVKRTLAVGKGHHKMAFASDKVYVSNITDNTVSVLKRD